MCGQKVVGRMTERTQRGDKGYNTGYLYRHQRSHLQLIKAHTYMVKVASLISLSVTKIHYQFVRRGRTGLSFTLPPPSLATKSRLLLRKHVIVHLHFCWPALLDIGL